MPTQRRSFLFGSLSLPLLGLLSRKAQAEERALERVPEQELLTPHHAVYAVFGTRINPHAVDECVCGVQNIFSHVADEGDHELIRKARLTMNDPSHVPLMTVELRRTGGSMISIDSLAEWAGSDQNYFEIRIMNLDEQTWFRWVREDHSHVLRYAPMSLEYDFYTGKIIMPMQNASWGSIEHLSRQMINNRTGWQRLT